MFEFLKDGVAVLYACLIPACLLMIGMAIRIYVSAKKDEHIKKLLWLTGGMVSLVAILILVGLFSFRAYGVYKIVLSGGSESLAKTIQEKYIEDENQHFYFLYTYGSNSFKGIKGFYRAHEVDEATRLVKSGIVPGTSLSFPNEMNTEFAYAALEDIKVNAGENYQDINLSTGISYHKESQRESVRVAEKILGKKLPKDVFIEDDKSSGSSAGLVQTLELIHLFGEDDLLRGMVVGGTGTINSDGEIGVIGGLKMKLIAAANFQERVHGQPFTFIFIPEPQYNSAKQIIKDNQLSIKIKPVKTIWEALDYLKEGRADQ